MDYTINNNIEYQIDKSLDKYFDMINSDCIIQLKIKNENNIVITEYYHKEKKVITVYEDKISGEVGIIENWKVK